VHLNTINTGQTYEEWVTGEAWRIRAGRLFEALQRRVHPPDHQPPCTFCEPLLADPEGKEAAAEYLALRECFHALRGVAGNGMLEDLRDVVKKAEAVTGARPSFGKFVSFSRSA
jgi:hypothetical protein